MCFEYQLGFMLHINDVRFAIVSATIVHFKSCLGFIQFGLLDLFLGLKHVHVG